MGEKNVSEVWWDDFADFFGIVVLKGFRRGADRINQTLGILMFVRIGGEHYFRRLVERDHAGVGTGASIHRSSAEPCNKPQHAGFRMQQSQPVRARGIPDSCCRRHEKCAVTGTGDSLDENSHLFVHLLKPSSFAIIESRHACCTGIDGFDRLFELLQTAFGRAAAAAEDRLVLSCERISEPVLQDGAGTDDDRLVAVILNQLDELCLYLQGKAPFHDFLCKCLRKGKIPIICALADFQIPKAIVHNIGIKHIRPNIKRIMRLNFLIEYRIPVFNNLSRKKHPARLAANHTCTDHPGMDFKIIGRGEILFDKRTQALVSGQHNIADPAALFRNVKAAVIHQPGSQEKALPAVDILVGCLLGSLVHPCIESADLHSL